VDTFRKGNQSPYLLENHKAEKLMFSKNLMLPGCDFGAMLSVEVLVSNWDVDIVDVGCGVRKFKLVDSLSFANYFK